MVSKPINKIGIAGGGKMGFSIFNLLCQFDLIVIWYLKKNAEKAQKKQLRKLNRLLKNGLISSVEYSNLLSRQIITSSIDDLKNCNLIIESISEDESKKKELINGLFCLADEDLIVASNTSSMRIENLAEKEYLNRMVGLHFFYPAEMKNIVELNLNSNTTEDTILSVESFLKKTNRQYVKLAPDEAFLLNRIMMRIQAGVYNIALQENCSFKQIDRIVKEFLFPSGVFEMMDHIGIDLIYKSVCNYIAFEGNKNDTGTLVAFMKDNIRKNRLGVKTGHGFINYELEEAPEEICTQRKESILKLLKNSCDAAFQWALNNSNISTIKLELMMNEYLDTEIKGWSNISFK